MNDLISCIFPRSFIYHLIESSVLGLNDICGVWLIRGEWSSGFRALLFSFLLVFATFPAFLKNLAAFIEKEINCFEQNRDAESFYHSDDPFYYVHYNIFVLHFQSLVMWGLAQRKNFTRPY